MSSALKLVRETPFVRMTGTRFIDPNGTPAIGIIPPYSVPVPSVPIIGSTKLCPSADPISADSASSCFTTQNAPGGHNGSSLSIGNRNTGAELQAWQRLFP